MRRCDFTKSIHSASQQSAPSCAHTDSKQATIFEVVLDDDVSDGVEDELNVVSVGGARLVTVDLFVGRLVLGLELGLYVGGCLVVHLLACTGNNTRQS